MTRFLLTVASTLMATATYAQTPAATAPADTAALTHLAQSAQRYLNNDQPDSLYMLMGDDFKKEISADKLREISKQLTLQLGKWTRLEKHSVDGNLARYKATFALAPLDLYISQDKQGKIGTFLFKPHED